MTYAQSAFPSFLLPAKGPGINCQGPGCGFAKPKYCMRIGPEPKPISNDTQNDVASTESFHPFSSATDVVEMKDCLVIASLVDGWA